jgi:hypothetical protein
MANFDLAIGICLYDCEQAIVMAVMFVRIAKAVQYLIANAIHVFEAFCILTTIIIVNELLFLSPDLFPVWLEVAIEKHVASKNEFCRSSL